MSDATVVDAGGKLSTDEARRLLQEEAKQRINTCQNEVAEALKRHGCQIQPQLVMTPGGSQFGVQIVPAPPSE